MSTEYTSKIEEEFRIIRDRLKKFNKQEKERVSSGNNLRIDYDYIFDIRLMEVDDFDLMTGAGYKRRVNEAEMKEILQDYAKEAFNINLSRSLTFENMVNQLTEEVYKLNNDEIDYEEAKKNEIPDSEYFTPADLLRAYDIALGVTSESTEKLNPYCMHVLSRATINMDKDYHTSHGKGSIRELSQEEIDEIIDEDFILGC